MRKQIRYKQNTSKESSSVMSWSWGRKICRRISYLWGTEHLFYWWEKISL